MATRDDDFSGTTSVGKGPTEASTPEGTRGEDTAGRFYLLVFERGSSWMYELPQSGQVIIGRSTDVDLRLRDNQVSRRHAVVRVTAAGAELEDLKSQNGTFLNGERISGPRALQLGDTLRVCGVTLAFYASEPHNQATQLVDAARFRERLEDEIERALRTHRSFAMMALHASGMHPGEPADEATVSRALGRLDVAAWSAPGELLVLLPEVPAEEVAAAANRLLSTLAVAWPDARVGYALCPVDGCDAGGLIAGTRAAAHASSPGTAAAVATSFGTRQIRGRTVVIADPAMMRLYALIDRLAVVDLPILLHGETGAGKELAAGAIHERSARHAQPLIAVNCAAIPENLLESELFGYERGAFSGAVSAKPGLFESADKGTLFLDEIGDLPLGVQAKLLRALETRKVTRIGDIREREVDVRLVAATNRDVRLEVKQGRFRRDLYHRLSGASLHVPPLRERTRELPLLAQRLLDEARSRTGAVPMEISPDAIDVLLAHTWPGNVRELKNVMDYVAAAHPEPVLAAVHVRLRIEASADLPSRPPSAATPPPPTPGPPRPLSEELRELEIRRMRESLEATGWNQTRSAEMLGIPVRTFFAKVKQYGLKRGL